MIHSILSALSPPRCPICSRWLTIGEHILCGTCEETVSPVADLMPAWPTLRPPVLLYLGSHHGTLRDAVLRLKFGDEPWRGRALGARLGEHARRAAGLARGGTRFAIVPVPLHPRRLRGRRYNQAGVIARGFAAEVPDVRFAPRLLRRHIYTEAQATADNERRRNRTNPFVVREGLVAPGRWRIILVDDVLTTGTTMRQAVQALTQAGFHVSCCATLTRTELRRASQASPASCSS